jgi:Putative transposase/Transposase zinc-binding domain
VHACAAPPPAPPGREGRPRFEVADIFRAHGEAYRNSHTLGAVERRAMRDIETCRTVVLGGHLDVCDACGDARPAYNSCRNRHCPKCQCLRQAKWVADRMERVLPTHHFHIVFTVPEECKPLALRNRIRFFEILFASASRTLLQLGLDPGRCGAQLGITAVLHTWTRKLGFHPHLHCIVTGGGLAPDGRWISVKGDGRFLFPVAVIRALFRGKLLAALTRARELGQLDFDGACADLADPVAFARWKNALYKKDWVVYCKPPFGGAQQVFKYLGRYTHRVGISNQRLRCLDERGVTFATKDGAVVTLAPDEFIRRFLLHVLPRGFVKIRHFGLLAPANVNGKLAVARRLLDPVPDPRAPLAAAPAIAALVALAADTGEPPPAPAWRELFRQLTGIDLARCRVCGQGNVVRFPLPVDPAPSPTSSPAFFDTS